ncbi:putative nuclear segregation protein [Erysiphe necator]|uniref:Putative nuclear segregation protein n=1 Tax=Uncinula necator TaxID=52586 RepID=A0A0B1PCU8_UNCNE|nr:putative nuclear segregation protein [Erysiphe necator]
MTTQALNELKLPVRPEKPDEEVYKARLKKAEKEHSDSVLKFNVVKNKLENAISSSSDSPLAKRRTELINQLKDIREKQNSGTSSRNKILDQIKREDAHIKELLSQQKTARTRVNFKSVDDLEREIDRLHKQINTGTMKIVDEKKALDTISLLHKQRKNFSGFEESQKNIDAKRKVIKQLREQLEDPESKALSEKYNKIQAELDAVKAEQDEMYNNISNLRDEKKKLQNIQQTKFLAMKEIKDNYYEQNQAVQKWEYEARQRARERKKAEEERFQLEKKKARAQQILDEASDKAYLEEIRRAHSLLRFLDPSYLSEKPPPLKTTSKLHALPMRQIDIPEIKGVRIAKKEVDDYFPGTGGKKGKKAKKLASKETSVPTKYSCPPAVMEDCAFLEIDPPMSSADIPTVKDKVLAKLNYWKTNQEVETERNIANARKEVERLETEQSLSLNSPTSEQSTKDNSVNNKTTTLNIKNEDLKSKVLEQNTQPDVETKKQDISLDN